MRRSSQARPRARAIPRTLRGRTVRWALLDGSGGTTVYHHTFNADGSIVYRGASLVGRGSRIRPGRSLLGRLSEGVFVVSYLNPPYTLTAFLDASSGKLQGVVSSSKMWSRFAGTWTVV